MKQTERRNYLIAALLKEQPQYSEIEIPASAQEQKILLRSLFNIRNPLSVTDEFLRIQNTYLQEEVRQKGITNIVDLRPLQNELYLWQGDITTLAADGIVNAANDTLLGCFCPNHGCIDNAIHTFAGVQLRLECNKIMQKQGHREETGTVKITPAFNLPAKYILHTVGPVIHHTLTEKDSALLASCYLSCLQKAEEYKLSSLAFCCISTGEFHFPNEKAAEIAVKTVREFKKATGSKMKVIFNVFKELDYKIYKNLLAVHPGTEKSNR